MNRMFLLTIALLATSTISRAQTFTSGPSQIDLIELFTSEGCSSSPPADRKLNALAKDRKLWTDFVPVAFHVDYWNYLGWTDPYSSPDYSARQRRYTKEWNARTTYTPCFVVNGVATRSAVTRRSKELPGELKVVLRNGEAAIVFSPCVSKGDYIAWVAPLSGKEAQSVTAGENRGRTLEHNFVVLGLTSAAMTPTANTYSATLHIPAAPRAKAIAVWISRRQSLAPIQATGGWLE